jgi:hypothetical protein
MIRRFVVWLLVFSAILLVLSLFGPSSTRTAYLGLAVFGTQVAVGLGWIVGHLAKLESELAKYLENHTDPEAAKALAGFLRKIG